jgi:polygalacturonase
MNPSAVIFTIIFFICGLYCKAQDKDKNKIIASMKVPKDRVWYATDFGATGDGKTLNTLAIQKTIDACTEAGGGMVRITQGTYITGTLFLKDKILLYIDANAVIMGSKNRQDYKTIQRLNIKQEPAFGSGGSFLIYAENAKHISIEGKGEINGNGDSFFYEKMVGNKVRRPKEWRPRGLICFVNCQFINLCDLFLSDSPLYTIWPMGCDDIKIDGITIRNCIYGPNTDGIDIDCCRRVSVSNCNIEGGDDAIAIKSDGGRLGTEERPCENIVVSNCILSSPPACGVRVGYEGDSPIKNCTFSNLAMYNCDHGVDIISILPDRGEDFAIIKGTRVENIQFDNIVMQDVRQPIYLWMGNERKGVESSSYMRNIRISNLIAKSDGTSFIGSTTEKNIENIFLSNIFITLTKNILKDTALKISVWGSESPYALYVSDVTGLYIDGFSVDFSNAKGYWRDAIYCNNSKNIVLSDISTKSKGALKLISQIGATNSLIRIHDCNPEDSVRLISADDNSHITVGCKTESDK